MQRKLQNSQPSLPKKMKFMKVMTYELSSDSDSDTDETEKGVTFDGELDPVVLTAEEEEEFQKLATYYQHDHFDIVGEEEEIDFSSLSEGSITPSPPHHDDDDDNLDAQQQQSQGTNPVTTGPETRWQKANRHKIAVNMHTHEKLLKFLTAVPVESESDLQATCRWNNQAKKVYSLFNVTMCIVHPNYFLASENFPHHTISSLLNELETSKLKKTMSWGYVKPHLKIFLNSFKGFEDLADVFHLEDSAHPLKTKFDQSIDDAWHSEFHTHRWYRTFKTLTTALLEKSNSHREATFNEHIASLFHQIDLITQGCFPPRLIQLELVLPAQKLIPEKRMDVKPDIMVQAHYPNLMLVGEVKKFGSKGLKHIDHRGRKVRKNLSDVSDLRPTPQTHLDTFQPQGQGDQLPPTVNEKEKSVPGVTTDEPRASTSKDNDKPRGQGDQLPPTANQKEIPVRSVTTDEPCASTSKEQTGSSRESEKSTIPVRPLDGKERYKVNTYLPQLFGQMLAAMQENETASNRTSFRFCKNYENVQFGFGVEGFKLRFVKLTLIDVSKREKPTVNGLLSGQRFKCHISMTQEFNLLKKHHLEMFYKTLLAMCSLCW